MPTILLIINKPSGGGAEKVFTTLLGGLSAAGYLVKVVYTSQNRIKFRLIRLIYNYLKILMISIRFNPMIISGLHEENLLAYLVPTRKRKILSLHSNEFPTGLLGRVHDKLYTRASAQENTEIVCVSKGLRSNYSKRIKGFKSLVIYNGLLDYPQCPEDQRHLDRLTIKPRELTNILVVGRFVHQKNILLAIEIFAGWYKINNSIKMTIVGEGPQADDILFSIKSKNLTDKVTVKPWSNDIDEEYQQHDILLFTSKLEGFGNVIVEAMSQGLYVFSTDCNFGPREILFPELEVDDEMSASFISNSYGTMVDYSDTDPTANTVLQFSSAYESFLTSMFIDTNNLDINKFFERFSKEQLLKNYLQLLGL